VLLWEYPFNLAFGLARPKSWDAAKEDPYVLVTFKREKK